MEEFILSSKDFLWDLGKISNKEKRKMGQKRQKIRSYVSYQRYVIKLSLIPTLPIMDWMKNQKKRKVGQKLNWLMSIISVSVFTANTPFRVTKGVANHGSEFSGW